MEEPQPGCGLPVAAAGVLGAGGGGGGGECGAPSLFSSGAARCRCPRRARRQCRASGWGLWSPLKRGVAEGGLPGAALGLRGPQRAAAADRSLGAAGGGRRCEAGPRAEGSVAALPSGAPGPRLCRQSPPQAQAHRGWPRRSGSPRYLRAAGTSGLAGGYGEAGGSRSARWGQPPGHRRKSPALPSPAKDLREEVSELLLVSLRLHLQVAPGRGRESET